MAKNKDPAVLFYTADFLADTTLWNYDELGRYIKLLCIQHLNDGISDEDFHSVADGCNRILEKFRLCEDGLYRNKRMQKEAEKRRIYSDSRRKNIEARYNKKSEKTAYEEQMKNICSTYVVHMENENINVIKDVVNYLNSKLNTNYKYTSDYIQTKIKARLNEGFTSEDFYTVIDKKIHEWRGTKLEKFLRPETLFGTKFQEYLNQIGKRDDEYAAPSQPSAPRHGDFDPNEAFIRALKRSEGG